jgi:hypothetical protein
MTYAFELRAQQMRERAMRDWDKRRSVGRPKPLRRAVEEAKPALPASFYPGSIRFGGFRTWTARMGRGFIGESC